LDTQGKGQVRFIALLYVTIYTNPGKYCFYPRPEIQTGVPVSLCGAAGRTSHHVLYLWTNPEKDSIGSLENRKDKVMAGS
jgi:hypothetical protein